VENKFNSLSLYEVTAGLYLVTKVFGNGNAEIMNIRKQLKFDIRLYLLCAFALIVLSVNILIVNNYRNTRSKIKGNYTRELKRNYEIVMNDYSKLADFIYYARIDNPEIKVLFAQGVKSKDLAEKNRYRKLLYHKLSELYQKLILYDFRQLHFHEKNNISYLRFHRPEKYGDDLTGVRYSVEYSNREQKSICGFEEGRIFNGYRFVYPIFFDDLHIGSVEISVSMKIIVAQLSECFKQKSQFIILKSQVAKKVFKSEISNYVTWFADDAYMLDREIALEGILQNKITEKDTLKIKNALAANRENGSPFCVEVKVDSMPFILSFLPIKNFRGKNVAYIFALFDGEEIKRMDADLYFILFLLLSLFILLILFIVYYRFSQNKIEKLATFDSLTNVYVRGVIMRVIKNEYEKYKRYKTPFSLIMIDVDHFKNINDTYGHVVGDLVLTGIAGIMLNNIRESDSIGRYGGEEFIVFLPETNAKNAAIVAEKLRQKIASHIFHLAGKVTVSLGVVEMYEQVQSANELIEETDKKLYIAKNEGRNMTVV
jgi:diguanylate cyclase (GGDEF)-like protein